MERINTQHPVGGSPQLAVLALFGLCGVQEVHHVVAKGRTSTVGATEGSLA